MATSGPAENDVFQQFRDKTKNELAQNVKAHRIGGGHYLYWSDIQRVFCDVDHLEKFLSKDDKTFRRGDRVLYEVSNGSLCYPLRVKYSPFPYTMITRGDIYDGSSELSSQEATRELDRMVQELAQLKSWFSMNRTADFDVVFQIMISVYQHQQDIVKRYSACLGVNIGNDRTPHFEDDRVYSLPEPLRCIDFPAPRLFLVLPSEVDPWDDNDVTTHKFRLYFLCDFKSTREFDHKSRCLIPRSEIPPKHIHLSSHPGYDLKRSQEFFREFGHFALEILKTIKDGYLDESSYVPTISTFSILKLCGGATAEHRLTRDNLDRLVDKSIAYIQQQQSASGDRNPVTNVLEQARDFVRNWLPQKYKPRRWMNGPETRRIQSFLHLPTGDNGMGGLLQTISPVDDTPARWHCSGHAFEHSSIEAIGNVIQSEGGHIDLEGLTANTQAWCSYLQQDGPVPRGFLMKQSAWHVDLQMGTIAISLATLGHARRFTDHLRDTKRTFDLTIRFAWGPSRTELKEVLRQINACNVRVLEIDVSNLGFLRHNPLEYTRDLFVEHVEKALWRPGQFLTLLGYPQESQSYMYLGVAGPIVYGFVLESNAERCNVDWWDIQSKLYVFFIGLTREPHSAKDANMKMIELSVILAPLIRLGLQGVDLFHLVTGFWAARLGVEDGAILFAVAGSASFWLFELTDYVNPTLRRLVIQYDMPGSMEALYQSMDVNPTLQQIDVPARGSEICSIIETIGKRWCGGPNPLEVTIYEQDVERTGRILATAIIKKGPTVFEKQLESVRATFGGKSIGKIFPKEDNMTIDFKTWECSSISGSLTNRDARILDILTRAHPSSVKSLTLNFSQLTHLGFASIQSVLSQSTLMHLNIECTALDSSNEKNIGQVLGAINWPTIKTFTLFGNNIAAWILLWARHTDLNHLTSWEHQLLSLSIVGPQSSRQELSHSSAVWLHSMIYLLSPAEVQLENIQMKDTGDWELIRGAVDAAGATFVESTPFLIQEAIVV